MVNHIIYETVNFPQQYLLTLYCFCLTCIPWYSIKCTRHKFCYCKYHSWFRYDNYLKPQHLPSKIEQSALTKEYWVFNPANKVHYIYETTIPSDEYITASLKCAETYRICYAEKLIWYANTNTVHMLRNVYATHDFHFLMNSSIWFTVYMIFLSIE